MKNVSYKLVAILLSLGMAVAACSEQGGNEVDAADSTAAAAATPDTDARAAQTEEFMERPASARLPGEAAHGSEIDAQSQQTFTALDNNNDGLLSAEEAAAEEKLTQRWDELDSDADNQLDAIEFSRFEAPAEKNASETGSQ